MNVLTESHQKRIKSFLVTNCLNIGDQSTADEQGLNINVEKQLYTSD